MTPYEYITIFTSIILGLAVVHSLSGISLMLDKEVKTNTYWLHTLWITSMFILICLLWWNNLPLIELETLSFLHFLILVSYAVMVFLLSGILFPQGKHISVDFRTHFESNRMRMYVLGMLFVLVDFADAWNEKIVLEGEWRVPQLINISAYFICFALGAKLKTAKMDAIAGVVFFIGLVIWLIATFVEGFA